MPTFLNVQVIFSFAEFREKGARVERPRTCGPRIRLDARLNNLGTRVRASPSVSDINSIVICRRRQPLRHVEGGAPGAPQRTR
jgi:hypothetical protein